MILSIHHILQQHLRTTWLTMTVLLSIHVCHMAENVISWNNSSETAWFITDWQSFNDNIMPTSVNVDQAKWMDRQINTQHFLNLASLVNLAEKHELPTFIIISLFFEISLTVLLALNLWTVDVFTYDRTMLNSSKQIWY